jgi:hypothetical protein
LNRIILNDIAQVLGYDGSIELIGRANRILHKTPAQGGIRFQPGYGFFERIRIGIGNDESAVVLMQKIADETALRHMRQDGATGDQIFNGSGREDGFDFFRRFAFRKAVRQEQDVGLL